MRLLFHRRYSHIRQNTRLFRVRIPVFVLLLIIPSCILNPGCECFAQTDTGKRTEVIILHLNDMHASTSGFAKLKYLSDSLKRTHPYVFIVSAGDNFTGNPYVDMVADKGAPMIDLMNQAGFAVSCFGNHEFDLGQAFLEKRIEQARFPFICANIKTGTSCLKQPPAYIVLKAGNLQIPIIGLIEINHDGIPDTHPSKVKGLSFTDPLKTAGEYTEMKKQYGNLIALTHLGVETDEKLAEEYPSFDVIIGGHSHTILKKALIDKGVMIDQAGSYQRFIGKLSLVFRGNSIEEQNDTLIATESIQGADREIQALREQYENNPEFEKVAGEAVGSISGKQNLGALMTDAMAWAAKTDFAFQNRGGIRIQSIPDGDIKVRDIYRLDPFGNQVMVFKMQGSEIASLILNAYKKEKDIDLIPSGMRYMITKGKQGQSPVLVMLNRSGKPLDPDKSYSVALNSYISAAYDFGHIREGVTLEMTTEDCLIRYLRKKHKVTYKDQERATLQSIKE